MIKLIVLGALGLSLAFVSSCTDHVSPGRPGDADSLDTPDTTAVIDSVDCGPPGPPCEGIPPGQWKKRSESESRFPWLAFTVPDRYDSDALINQSHAEIWQSSGLDAKRWIMNVIASAGPMSVRINVPEGHSRTFVRLVNSEGIPGEWNSITRFEPTRRAPEDVAG